MADLSLRAVTEALRAKGLLSAHDMLKIKELRDALADEIRKREEGPQIVPPGRGH